MKSKIAFVFMLMTLGVMAQLWSPSSGGTPGDSSGGTPGGSSGQVQFNNGGAFGASTNVSFNDAANIFSLNGASLMFSNSLFSPKLQAYSGGGLSLETGDGSTNLRLIPGDLSPSNPSTSLGQTREFQNIFGGSFFVGGATASRPAYIDASKGIVSASGTPDGTKFLRDDGVLAVPSGGGSQTPYTSTHDGAGYNLTNLGYLSIGAAASVEPIRVGTNDSQSINSQIIVAREIASQPDAGPTNEHAFSDSTVWARTNAGWAYNSFDARTVTRGFGSLDHYAAFQALPVFSSGHRATNYYAAYLGGTQNSGATNGNWYGMYEAPIFNGTTFTGHYGTRYATPTGSSTLPFDYAIVIEPRMSSATIKHAIWLNEQEPRLTMGTGRDSMLTRDSAFTNQFWIDASSAAGSPTGLHGADGNGANFAGGDLGLTGGRSTGTGAGGAVIIGTSTNGISGSAVNNLTERLRVTAAGRVGIGTNAPSALLHLQSQSSNLVFAITGVTNVTPANGVTVAAWIPISLNGTNGFIPFYQ